MPKFEDFISKKEQDRKLFSIGEAMEKFSSSENDYAYGTDQLEEKLKARIGDKDTFEERTAYYFKNTDMLGAKAHRYKNLSYGDKEVQRFSEKYGNKKASSRMSAAGKAGEYFELANKEVKVFDEKDKNPYEIFKHRAKVMEYRLKARHQAASAKSKSSEHENYLKDKATLSCMMILREQLENLAEKTQDKKLLSQFNKKRNELDRMIEGAKDRLARSGKSAARIWQESGTGEDNLFDRKFKDGKYHELASQNPALTEEGARLLLTLGHMDKNKPQWPLRVVLKTKAGTCVTQGEKEKDQINEKYNTTENQQEKNDIMLAALKRVEGFVIPNPKEIGGKEIIKKLNGSLSDYYDVICVALPHLLNAKEDSFEKKYMDEHPAFREKLNALSTYKELVNEHLRQNGIDIDADGKFRVAEVKKKEEKKKPEKIKKIEQTLIEQYQNAKNLDDMTSIPKGANDRFTQDDLFRFRQIQRNISVFNTKNHVKKAFRALYAIEKKKLRAGIKNADELAWRNTTGKLPSYLRAVSVILDNVGDVNKRETRRDNNDRLKVLLSGKQSEIDKLVKSSATKIFDEIKLPTIEEIKGGWFEKMMNEKPDALLTMFRKTECIEDLMRHFPSAGASLGKNKVFMEKYETVLELNELFRNHMKRYHGFDPGAGAMDMSVTMNMSEEDKNKIGLDETKSGMQADFMNKVAYCYAPKMKKKNPGRIGRKRRRKLKRLERERIAKERLKKEEEAKKKTKTKIREDINDVGTKLIVMKLYDGSEEWHYTKKKGKEYVFIKKQPKDITEAIRLRKEVLDVNSLENMDEYTLPVFDHYNTYIQDWLKNNDVNTLADPKILEKKDLTGLDLEAVAMLRNEILSLGFIETDLSGKILEVYNYYTDAINRLKKIDNTLNIDIVQHEMRKAVSYNISLSTNLDREYEMQDAASNDCWSCAGVGIFNHFIRNVDGYKSFKQSQAQFRDIKMEYVPQKDSNLDEESYEKRRTDIETFTTLNHSKDRRQSPMGDPYVTADFYIERLRKIPGYENSAVRKSVFNFIAADSYVKGVGGQSGPVKKDTSAVHNLTEYFKKTIADALAKDSAVALLLGRHYVTITGIEGDTLKIRDSNNSTRKAMKLSDVTYVDEFSRPVELVWLEKINDPESAAGAFSTLDYDKETGTFSSNARMREVGSYEEEIAHKQGVGAWKTVDDKDEDISGFVSEAIYVPRTFMSAKK